MLTAQNRVTTLYKYVKHQSLIPIIQQLGVDVLLYTRWHTVKETHYSNTIILKNTFIETYHFTIASFLMENEDLYNVLMVSFWSPW